MDAFLKDREVLCLLDTRQIQRFMFRSNTMLDTLGGSDLMIHILPDAIRYALTHIDPPLAEGDYDINTDPDAEIPYFTNEKTQFQLLNCAAGNAMFVARTGALAQKIVRKISRYYLDHAYCLNLAASIVEKTGNFGSDIFNLYRNLNAIKASSDSFEPLGALPVVDREKKTGEPVIGIDETRGDPISQASRIRRQEAKLRGEVITFQQLGTTRAFDGNEYRAVIHADGNNLGITIGRIMQETADYETATRFRREINRMIEEKFARIVSDTIHDLETHYQEHFGGKDFSHQFQIIHQAGDDINIDCNANLAFPFVQFFFQNLKGTFIWKTEEMEVPLYCCAGIAFVQRDTDFHAAFELAEECCDSAKKAAKKKENLQNGLAGNWIDFQVLDNPYSQELDMLRQRFYTTGEQVSLLLRPYSLGQQDADKPYAYNALIKRIRALQQYPMTAAQRKVMRQSYMLGTERFGTWCLHLYREKPELTKMLGAPIWRDSEGGKHATWFDAEELLDFAMAWREE